MYPDLQQLDAFVCVANHGSFTKAAEHLYLSQPAVSKRISALEDLLHCRLFDRIGRRIILTEAGRLLLPRAKQVLSTLKESKRLLDELQGQVGGELTVASSHHIALYHLPHILRQFNQQYAGVDLRLSFLDSERACQEVASGELEMAVVTLPEEDQMPDLLRIHLWQDPLEVVVGLNHPLGEMQHWDPKALLQYPAILPPTGSVTRNIIEQQLNIEHTPLNLKLTSIYLETIKTLVIAGLAWSVLPKSMNNGELYTLPFGGKLMRELGLVYHRNRSLSNAAKAFFNILQTTT